MKISENWLREWVDPKATSEELAERLTMAGLELDEAIPAASNLDGVIVARIDAIDVHPNADRLKVCQVNTGASKLQQVVCGAANARVGLVAAFATEGTILPSGVKIKATELRGVASCGMLCSSSELGLDEDAEGLLELDENLELGKSLSSELNLNDIVFDIDLTPNRADCLSVQGIAREVSALYQIAVKDIGITAVDNDSDNVFTIEVEAREQCPRYCGRIVRDINAAAPTPVWMRERLRRSGIRSISIIVDICNYVMLELGQPMHAFDLDKLSNKITVRLAQAKENLHLLDGREVQLEPDNLVIADAKGALALAGVMGGSASAVEFETKNIFLESAFFAPLAIIGKARKYGLHTESSHRFERGVDPELAVTAINRATELVKKFAGGNAGPVNEVVDTSRLPKRAEISLELNSIRQILGIEIDSAEVTQMLESLACEVRATSATEFSITPPSYRFDLTIDTDLVEEIARMRGYDQMPTAQLAIRQNNVVAAHRSEAIYALQQNLAGLGYSEAVTFSFTEKNYCDLFSSVAAKMLSNPISSEMSAMRTSLWPGLCLAADYNLKRQQPTVRLFEVGRKYIVQPGGINQVDVLAGVATGDVYPRQWGLPARALDFFDIKGDLEWLFAHMGIDQRISYQPTKEIMGLHPGKTMQINIDLECIGVLGVLHPNVAKQLNLPNRDVVVFEIMLNDKTLRAPQTLFRVWSKFPVMRRDLSIVVDEAVPVQDLLEKLYSLQIKELQDIVVFALYQGKGIPEGRKSVSLGLILQDFSSTLTDQQVEQIMTNIITQLAKSFQAELRNA